MIILSPEKIDFLNFDIGSEGVELVGVTADEVNAERFFYDQYNDESIKFSLKGGGNEIIVRRSYFDRIQDAGKLIKVDFSVTKPRRMSAKKARQVKTGTNPTQSASSKEVLVESFDPSSIQIESRKLEDTDFDPALRIPIKTGTYFDTFCSRKGGVLPGTNIMVTGDPGVGKSSNLMDIQVNINKNEPARRVLYVSAEMKPIDVDEFNEFYPGLEKADFFYVYDYLVNPENDIPVWKALMSILHQGWDLVILDSFVELQSIAGDELGLTGRKSERWLLDLMAKHNGAYNERGVYTSFLAIQQMNKSGSYVGSKRLEHMTDAFLQLKWCKEEKGRRYMEFEKNRKGKEKVKLYYAFGDGDGIQYSSKRHSKELETLEIMQKSEHIDAEEVTEEGFFKMFEKAEEEAMNMAQS